MLERRSALAAAQPYTSSKLELREMRDFSLVQISGLGAEFEEGLTRVLGPLPREVGLAEVRSDNTVLRIGPSQYWIIGPGQSAVQAEWDEIGAVTSLSHSRTRIVLDGTPARDVLSKGIPLDFHTSAFTPGKFAMTGLHHTPVTVHCVSENRLDLYVMRTFAMSVWDWLRDAALEFVD